MFRYGYVTKRKVWTNDTERKRFESLLYEMKKKDKNKPFYNNSQLELMSEDPRHPQVVEPFNQVITTRNSMSGERSFGKEGVVTHSTTNSQDHRHPSTSSGHHIVDHDSVNSGLIDPFALFRSNLISDYPNSTFSEIDIKNNFDKEMNTPAGYEKWTRKANEANLREGFQESQWL